MARKKNVPSPKGGTSVAKAALRLYTLDVVVIGGRISDEFSEKNPTISRTIQIRGDQTLEDLHFAIFQAFDREDEHLYEFQFGKKPMDRGAPRYPAAEAFDPYEAPGHPAHEATIESLELRVRRNFFYWFDFGDDWWHKITVAAIDDDALEGDFPKVVKRVGESPPQYPGLDDEEYE